MKKLSKLLFLILLVTVLFSPFISFASGVCDDNPNYPGCGGSTSPSSACDTLSGLGKLVCTIQKLLNSVIPLLVALGVVYFVWGVVQYVIGGGEEAKKKGRDTIIFGIIGLAVIIGLWGLVKILTNTFDIEKPAPSGDLQKLLPS